MKRKLLAMLVLVMGLLPAVGLGENPYATVSEGILYFNEVGTELESAIVEINGFEERDDGILHLAHQYRLKPHEYTIVPTPVGVVGVDIHMDSAPDDQTYDQVEFRITGGWNAADRMRKYSSVSNGYQSIPQRLYLYRLQTNGMEEGSIRSISSIILDPTRGDFNTSYHMYIQELQLTGGGGMQEGLDDADSVYLVGGDYVQFTLTPFAEFTGPGYYQLFECEKNLRKLAIGESVTVALKENVKTSRKRTITITKEALLRDVNLTPDEVALQNIIVIPDPIVWPENAIGRIVVLSSGTNVREGGSTDYKAIGKVHQGDAFFALGMSPSGWYGFELPGGGLAYISPKMVEFEPRPK